MSRIGWVDPKLEFSHETTMGERINLIVQDRGISMTALAEQTDIHRKSLHDIVHDDAVPSAVTLIKLACALDVSMDFLAGLTNEPRSLFTPITKGHKHYAPYPTGNLKRKLEKTS